MTYDLHWKCLRMRDIENYAELGFGKGVYMFVLETTGGQYVAYYVGSSKHVGERWREHRNDWFLNPPNDYHMPVNAEEFLADPVRVLNEGELKQGLQNRQETGRKMYESTWACFAKATCHQQHCIKNVEYILQEALKKHVKITVNGWIGDAGAREKPESDLLIHNHFEKPEFLDVLPAKVSFKAH